MKALSGMNYVVWLITAAVCVFALVSEARYFIPATIGGLAAVTWILTWTTFSVACAIPALLSATPLSMSQKEVRPYIEAFSLPASACLVIVGTMLLMYQDHWSPQGLAAVLGLVSAMLSLVGAAGVINTRLVKPDAKAEPTT